MGPYLWDPSYLPIESLNQGPDQVYRESIGKRPVDPRTPWAGQLADVNELLRIMAASTADRIPMEMSRYPRRTFSKFEPVQSPTVAHWQLWYRHHRGPRHFMGRPSGGMGATAVRRDQPGQVWTRAYGQFGSTNES